MSLSMTAIVFASRAPDESHRRPALSMIGLLDRRIVDLLERHGRLAWIAGDRILLAVELSVITLSVPAHLKSLGGHTVLHRTLLASRVLLLVPGSRKGVRTRRRGPPSFAVNSSVSACAP
jgi:hypothetical protein